MLAALVVTTPRLLAWSPRLLTTVVPATWATAVLAAHSVQIGERAVRLNSGEKIVLRPRTR